jgi:uncharacterized protein (TIGR00251 family)
VDESIRAPEDDGEESSILSVRAQPGARREGCVGTWNGMIKIALRAPPEDGRANARLVEIVAELFGLRRSAVEIVSGASARIKRIRLPLPAATLSARIAEILAAADSDRTDGDP